MVSIRYVVSRNSTSIKYSNFYCSGSLIYKNFVLTTAHCFNNKNFPDSDLVVFVGKSFLDQPSSSSEVYFASKLYIHPGYNRTTAQHDIAFIKLENYVTLSDRVALICLPSIDLLSYPYNKLIIGVGWGRTTIGVNDLTAVSNELRQTTLKVINGDPSCNFHPKYDESLMYCVAGTRNGSNFCWGKYLKKYEFHDDNLFFISQAIRVVLCR